METHRQAQHDPAPGVVLIGRNEGERLGRALAALAGVPANVVYVDSGSSDDSLARARDAGACVLSLAGPRAFTAARARNAGFEHLMELAPATEFVQFLDGDCELAPGWLERATQLLRTRPEVVVVCGRRRERHPAASRYNRLCDIEWDTPIGEARACGGDALMRTSALRAVGGYTGDMIAGEEPELCLRLARRGGHILRLAAEMSRHDAAMTRWTQWWQRALRTGHTSAELLARHGATREHGRLRRASSAVVWAVALPLAATALAWWGVATERRALLAAALLVPGLLYLLLFERVRRRYRARGLAAPHARLQACSCLLAKWPECQGLLLYALRRVLRREAHWIEYKDAPHASRALDAQVPRRTGAVRG